MDDKESLTEARGGRQSIIQSFGIEGLYGYRSISLDSEYAATILIAKNGTGKTTLLGALNAFLKLELSRLRNLEFTTIRCKLRAHPTELILSHNDIIDFLQIPLDGEFLRVASRSGVETADLFNFVIGEWPGHERAVSERIYDAVLRANNYNSRETRRILDGLKAYCFERQPNIRAIAEAIRNAIGDFDIVYLPTFRRIELSLTDQGMDERGRRRRGPRFHTASDSLLTGDIQFGLGDISERLSEMNQQIILQSNNGYGRISANIIKDLIDGNLEEAPNSEEKIPTEDELRVFFTRVQQGARTGPYAGVPQIDLDKLSKIDVETPQANNRFLRYFLVQLNTVIATTKQVEEPVEGFIDSCNKYLHSEEPSTEISGQKHNTPSGKKLALNRRTLGVHVHSVPEGRQISLDALSSGEKQMISLFAKLYLYPGNKIVLIDEPELSLSIDWQMEILEDVLSAPLCSQVVAITHSPFVFDNTLEPFAKSLKVSAAPVYGPDAPLDEEHPDE